MQKNRNRGSGEKRKEGGRELVIFVVNTKKTEDNCFSTRTAMKIFNRLRREKGEQHKNTINE